MKDILFLLLSLLIGIGASCIWFGFLILFSNLTKRIKWMKRFLTVLASIPLLIVVFFVFGFVPLNINTSSILIGLVIVLITVLICVTVVYLRNNRRSLFGKDLLLWGIDGVLMEISQRLMMQSLMFGVLSFFKVPYIEVLTVICTAVVWCIALFLQNRIQKNTLDKEFLKEIIASFIFSLGIGWTYQITGFIVLPMLGHFLERISSNYLLRKKFKDSLEKEQ